MGYMVKWVHPENGPAEVFVHSDSELVSTLASLGVSMDGYPDEASLIISNGQPVYWTTVPSVWVDMALAIAQFEGYGADEGDDGFSRGQAKAYGHCAERFRGILGRIIRGS